MDSKVCIDRPFTKSIFVLILFPRYLSTLRGQSAPVSPLNLNWVFAFSNCWKNGNIWFGNSLFKQFPKKDLFLFFQLFNQKMNLCHSKWSPSRKIHGQFVMEILLRWQNHLILHNLFLLPVFYYETPWHLPWPKSMKLNCLSFNHDNCNYKTFMWNISVSDGNIVNK